MVIKRIIILLILFSALNSKADLDVRHVAVSAAINTALYLVFTRAFKWESKPFAFAYAAILTSSVGIYWEAVQNELNNREFIKDVTSNAVGITLTLPLLLLE